MPDKQTSTQCVVRLVALRGLSPATLLHCQALRGEAGQVWTDLVTLLTQSRTEGRRLSAGEFEQGSSSRRPRVGSTPSIARACRRCARNPTPLWRRPPRCDGRR